VKEQANQEIGAPGGAHGGGREAWHSRGYLPHFDDQEVTQHVTFRLADSLAKQALQCLDEEIRSLPPEKQKVERRKRVDAWIDAGPGSRVLREPATATTNKRWSMFILADCAQRLRTGPGAAHQSYVSRPIGRLAFPERRSGIAMLWGEGVSREKGTYTSCDYLFFRRRS
jgi:hypothetical protein